MKHRSVMRFLGRVLLGALTLASFAPAEACTSPRKKDCTAFLDVEATLARDMRTYEDPKIAKEHAQNWRDTANKMDKGYDSLGKLSLTDGQVAVWAGRTRELLAYQAALGQRLAAAREKEDWPTYEPMRVEWEANAAKLAGIKQDASVYCQ